jgi:hypothetical protein
MFQSAFFFFCKASILFCLSTQVFSGNKQAQFIDSIFSEVNEKKLYSDLSWLRLLHFRVKPVISDHSDIISTDFFLAYNEKQHGKKTLGITAREEMYATIRGFFQPVKSDSDAHPQCRFPARLFWLKKRLHFPKDTLPKVECRRLENWAKFNTLDSVSLIMVSGYFGNPASTFGHLLVKLNNSEYKSSSGDLLDQSINYGAKVPEKELIPVYIYKGLLGGYISSFSDKKFYTQDRVYSKQEFRDMWEYELNLSDDQQKLMVYHIWEMMGRYSTYYFLKENCAYRIAELLELVTGNTLTPARQPWYLPLSVFQGLSGIEQSKYIKRVTFLPSSQRKLYWNFNQLSDSEARAVNVVLGTAGKLKMSVFDKFPANKKTKMLNVMLEYYQYKLVDKDKGEDELKFLKERKNALLRYRLKLPIENKSPAELSSITPLESPANGAKPRLFRVGIATNNTLGEFLQIGLAGVHFDVLTNSRGSLKNATLTVMDLNVGVNKNNHVFIDRLDIVNIQKIGLNDTRLIGEKNLSWRVGLGFERTDLNCQSCTNFYLKGGIGKAYKFKDPFILYGFLDAKYIAENNALEIAPSVGVISTLNQHLKLTLQLTDKINVDTGDEDESFKLDTRYSFSKNNTLRLSYEKFRGEEFRLSFYHHW